ncbi:hypothetical protein LHYA1_G000387 [Lachnellula hyalina]|uniref:Peptide N-acetyl-beta-D-glucosaminyl asparaginase amidase A N-terminal domain-containing protein n=1 Tax=Lachnellula hyalina TaxID=1316788 RepID=A0A8H8U3Z8_9HELO|nr:uncharacterized protein LHYA1_G000387 [Lachnellula hyalina]TVY30808.1 hypothetical protein LHYA1_G000387 [Lachnellula hyalina]
MLILIIFAALQLGLYTNCIASPTASISANQDESGVVKSPLDVFEVQAPLRASYEGTSCEQVVLQYTFAGSYGTPYVVTSSGINYDRLGLIYFGDIEVWRTTTAMPVRTGIFGTTRKT